MRQQTLALRVAGTVFGIVAARYVNFPALSRLQPVLNAAERPAQSPQRNYLLAFLGTQDVRHPDGEHGAHRLRQRLGAGGRFWVSTEALRGESVATTAGAAPGSMLI